MSTEIDTVFTFLERVGRARFEHELGHKPQVVTRAVRQNQFPAHWYFACRDWCRELGLETPEHLFRQSMRPREDRAAQSVKRYGPASGNGVTINPDGKGHEDGRGIG